MPNSVARVHRGFPYAGKYPATERLWVARLLSLLTPDEIADYEQRMRTAPCHHNGKLYDKVKGRIAEQVLLDHRRRGGT